MKAIAYSKFGGPEVLKYVEIPEPKFAQHNLIVKVITASLNPADIVLQNGLANEMMETWFPVIPGWDFAGIVEKVGQGVSDFKIGDEVVGFFYSEILHQGTFAEKISVPSRLVVHKPKNVSWQEAGALPLVGLTSYQAIKHVLKVEAKESILIFGGTGGVGSVAIQIAKNIGAVVFAPVAAEDFKFIESLGAIPLNNKENIDELLKNYVPNGVDVIFNTAHPSLSQEIKKLRNSHTRLGTIVGGENGESQVFARPDKDDLSNLLEMKKDNMLKVHVAYKFSLERVPDAQKLLMDRSRKPGKIIIEI